jgi:protein FAM50
MKKGDFIWVFLDKSRKVGAELGVGEQANATRAWARVGVDDLMLVRGTVIIPHVSVIIIYSSILLFSLCTCIGRC